MKPCPVCGSNEIYQHQGFFPSPGTAGGETLLPGLGSFFSGVEICPFVCHSCGYIRLFASEEARQRLKTSKHWKLVGD